MKYQEIINEIKSGKFRPVYFLFGEEPYFIDQIVKNIEKYALSEEEKSFNQSILYGRDVNISTVIGEAKRYPMMAERVLVIVKEAQHLKSLDELESYSKNIQPTTVLVFAYKYKKPDKRKKYYKALGNVAVMYESKKLYDNQVPVWIEQSLKGKGYNLTMKAGQLLAESLGSDLGRIESELQKLQFIVPKGSTIDEEIVEQNIGISKDYNNFELINAIAVKDFGKAIKIVQYFASNPKDNPLVLTVALLYGFFTKVMLIHQTKDRSNKNLGVLLKVNPYFLDDYKVAAGNYDLKKLARIISWLRECDTKSKGINNVSTSDADLLREFLVKVFNA